MLSTDELETGRVLTYTKECYILKYIQIRHKHMHVTSEP